MKRSAAFPFTLALLPTANGLGPAARVDAGKSRWTLWISKSRSVGSQGHRRQTQYARSRPAMRSRKTVRPSRWRWVKSVSTPEKAPSKRRSANRERVIVNVSARVGGKRLAEARRGGHRAGADSARRCRVPTIRRLLEGEDRIVAGRPHERPGGTGRGGKERRLLQSAHGQHPRHAHLRAISETQAAGQIPRDVGRAVGRRLRTESTGLPWAGERGWLTLNIMPHDLPFDKPPAFYDEAAKTTLKDYPRIGSDNRETSYFLRMMLGCYRAGGLLAEQSGLGRQDAAGLRCQPRRVSIARDRRFAPENHGHDRHCAGRLRHHRPAGRPRR